MRRAVKLTSTLIAATAISGGAAVYAVAVSVPADDFSVNLGLLLQAGHRYRFYEWENISEDTSYFTISEAELRLYGRVFEGVDYDLRLAGFSGVREAYVGTDFPAGFSAKIGRNFVPFGVEATTEEGYLTCTSRTRSSERIAPGREYGLRFDYVHTSDNWPYEFGAAAGVYNNRQGPLVDGAARVYARPVPGAKTLSIGCSFYYGKEYREIYNPRRLRHSRLYSPATLALPQFRRTLYPLRTLRPGGVPAGLVARRPLYGRLRTLLYRPQPHVQSRLYPHPRGRTASYERRNRKSIPGDVLK